MLTETQHDSGPLVIGRWDYALNSHVFYAGDVVYKYTRYAYEEAHYQRVARWILGPCVPEIYDVEPARLHNRFRIPRDTGDYCAIIMEKIPAVSLYTHIESLTREGYDRDHALSEIKTISSKITKLAEKLNSCGIYHNDMHLGNILVKGEQVYLIDFGIASYTPNRISDADMYAVELNKFLSGKLKMLRFVLIVFTELKRIARTVGPLNTSLGAEMARNGLDREYSREFHKMLEKFGFGEIPPRSTDFDDNESIQQYLTELASREDNVHDITAHDMACLLGSFMHVKLSAVKYGIEVNIN